MMSQHWKKIESVLANEAGIRKLAKKIEGFDARRIRKTVLAACTFESETALNPNLLTIKDLDRAFTEESKK